MQYRSIVINIVLLTLFAIGTILMMVQFSIDNELTPITEDSRIGDAYANLSSGLDKSISESSTSRGSFTNETKNMPLTSLGFVSRSIINAGDLFISNSINILNFLAIMSQEVLGVNPIVTGTILAILILSLVLGVWRLIRSGE